MPAHSRISSLMVMALMVTACGTPSPSTRAPSDPAGPSARVERIIDGDSVELLMDGELVEARLIGINAPELADCQGPGARDALEAVAAGESVTVNDFGTDRFGRLLVDLSIGDESINQALVRAGWALAVHGTETNWTPDMREAAESGLGMWDLPDACPRPAADLAIVDIEPDPAGPDDEVLIDEWIELENRGSDAVGLAGWALRDESTSNRFVFADGTLEPGATLRLRTGCGTDSATDVHWCSPNGVWSNRGETALLLAPSGAIVDHIIIEP